MLIRKFYTMFVKMIKFLSLLLLLPACNNNSGNKITDTQNDRNHIYEIIINESRDFYRKDFAAWSSHYIHAPEVFWLCVEEDVSLRADGWADLEKFVHDWMIENPEAVPFDNDKYKIENLRIDIDHNTAFATFQGKFLRPDGNTRMTKENRILKKTESGWKILSMSSYPDILSEGSTKNVFVHRSK